jgi:fructose-1,6-bisphosphatase II
MFNPHAGPDIKYNWQRHDARESDPDTILTTKDLAPGQQILFAATGVTDGNLLRGARFCGDGIRPHSLVLTQAAGKVRFIDSIHLDRRVDVTIRL